MSRRLIIEIVVMIFCACSAAMAVTGMEYNEEAVAVYLAVALFLGLLRYWITGGRR